MNWLPDDGRLIGCGVVLLVVLFNVGLIYSFLKPAARQYMQEMRGGMIRGQNPWEREAESLQELRDAVEKLDRSERSKDE